MIYGFDTEDEAAATGALLVYAVWRSRDQKRFKVTPDVWSQVERFVKASAKRAETLPRFLEALKPRLSCGTIDPRWMRAGMAGEIPAVVTDDGVRLVVAAEDGQREFLAGVFGRADHGAALERLYRDTAWVILLVRDRLERERPVEARFAATVAEGEDDGAVAPF